MSKISLKTFHDEIESKLSSLSKDDLLSIIRCKNTHTAQTMPPLQGGVFFRGVSQGVALGFHRMPRWGCKKVVYETASHTLH